MSREYPWTEGDEVIQSEANKKARSFTLPKGHKPGLRVPLGGSSCESCEYFKGGRICGNQYFIQWNGSSTIPAEPDEYCSDWWEPKK